MGEYHAGQATAVDQKTSARCRCCGGSTEVIIRKKCPCWIYHFAKPPWENVTSPPPSPDH